VGNVRPKRRRTAGGEILRPGTHASSSTMSVKHDDNTTDGSRNNNNNHNKNYYLQLNYSINPENSPLFIKYNTYAEPITNAVIDSPEENKIDTNTTPIDSHRLRRQSLW
jgi:hypothetical protein